MDAPGFMVPGPHTLGKRVCIPYRSLDRVKPYVAAITAAGAEAVAQSVSGPISLAGFDGLVLTGGTDVETSQYGEQPAPEVDAPDRERDQAEWRLLEEAEARDLPVLAICRGLQLVNVYRGGTLTQHLGSPRHDTDFADKSTVAHEVVLSPQSSSYRIYQTSRFPVNSRHHQAVGKLGSGLSVSAWDNEDETIVEGLEDPSRKFLICVQWHPEDQSPVNALQRRLFTAFVQSL
jgi:putative glutamine amidotransferase